MRILYGLRNLLILQATCQLSLNRKFSSDTDIYFHLSSTKFSHGTFLTSRTKERFLLDCFLKNRNECGLIQNCTAIKMAQPFLKGSKWKIQDRGKIYNLFFTLKMKHFTFCYISWIERGSMSAGRYTQEKVQISRIKNVIPFRFPLNEQATLLLYILDLPPRAPEILV